MHNETERYRDTTDGLVVQLKVPILAHKSHDWIH